MTSKSHNEQSPLLHKCPGTAKALKCLWVNHLLAPQEMNDRQIILESTSALQVQQYLCIQYRHWLCEGGIDKTSRDLYAHQEVFRRFRISDVRCMFERDDKSKTWSWESNSQPRKAVLQSATERVWGTNQTVSAYMPCTLAFLRHYIRAHLSTTERVHETKRSCVSTPEDLHWRRVLDVVLFLTKCTSKRIADKHGKEKERRRKDARSKDTMYNQTSTWCQHSQKQPVPSWLWYDSCDKQLICIWKIFVNLFSTKLLPAMRNYILANPAFPL